MFQWIRAHDVLLGWAFTLSVAMFLAALVLVPVVVVRLPADYFAEPGRRPRRVSFEHPLLRAAWRAAKNAFGLLLVAAGIAMLVLPGQGVLTILIGVSVMDFPGKYRLERGIIHRGPVLKAINALRRRFGRPPLVFDHGRDKEPQAPGGKDARPHDRPSGPATR